MLRSPLRMLICLAVGTLWLAGCSGNHGTLGSPDWTGTDWERSDPPREIQPLGPPHFPMPAEARQKNEVGSEFFARYYIGTMNRAISSLDSAPLRDLSRHCRACEALAGAIDATKARGDTRVGGLIIVDSMTASVIHGNAAAVTFQF